MNNKEIIRRIMLKESEYSHFEIVDADTGEVLASEEDRDEVKRLRELLKEAPADLLDNHARQIKVCHWTEDMDGIWTRSCSETPWEFGSPGTTPSENGMRVCLECGGVLIEHEYKEDV